jgi:hypothetical protein
MKKKWEKGDPVNISDLLKITPLANEAMHLSDELKISVKDLLWIIAEIAENNSEDDIDDLEESLDALDLEQWDDSTDSFSGEELDSAEYIASVRLWGINRFPEVEFKVGINEKEDLSYFFEMILDMMDKLD